MPTSTEHYEQGNLSEAITAAEADVRSKPTDAGKRLFLAELLGCRGEYERADKQLNALIKVQPQLQVHASILRQILRAAKARDDFYTSGRLPEFLEEPGEDLQQLLRASVAFRDGDFVAAKENYGACEANRVACRGTCNGQPFDDFRDLDDRSASFLEVYTANGKYAWIPIQRVTKIKFEERSRVADLIWCPAKLTVPGLMDEVQVFLPSTYAGSHDADGVVAMGRATEWIEASEGLVSGRGQREFLVGSESQPMLELQEVEFETADT